MDQICGLISKELDTGKSHSSAPEAPRRVCPVHSHAPISRHANIDASIAATLEERKEKQKKKKNKKWKREE